MNQSTGLEEVHDYSSKVGWSTLNIELFLVILTLKQSSTECCKTNIKVTTLANH